MWIIVKQTTKCLGFSPVESLEWLELRKMISKAKRPRSDRKMSSKGKSTCGESGIKMFLKILQYRYKNFIAWRPSCSVIRAFSVIVNLLGNFICCHIPDFFFQIKICKHETPILNPLQQTWFDVAFQNSFCMEESMRSLRQTLLKLSCVSKDSFSISLFAFPSFPWLFLFVLE